MKKLNYSIVITCLILVYSCKKDNRLIKNEIKEFPNSIRISAKPVKDIELTCTFANLMVIDTFLVIQTEEEPFFHIYDTGNYELLAEFGNKGRGPNEFVGPELLNQISYDEYGNPIFKVYDISRRRITDVNILNAIKSDGEIFNQKSVPDHINDFLVYFYYSDESLLIASTEEGGRFNIYDESTKSTKEIPYIPKVDFDIKEPWIAMSYRSHMVVNKNRNLIASTPIAFGEIDFFDIEGNHRNSSVWESSDDLRTELSKKNEDDVDLKIHTIDMDAKNDLIYALSFNNKLSEFHPEPSKNIKDVEIKVFDWEGKATKEFLLGKRYITSFAVDEKNNRFFAFCPGELRYNIISYDFEK